MGRILLLSMLLCAWTMQAQIEPSGCPVVENDHQSFCESLGGDDFHRPRISDLAVTDTGTGVTWYDSATSTTALASDYLLEDGGVYYADNSSGTCTARSSVTVTILDSPNAGATTSVTFCSNQGPVDLLTVYRSSILGPPDAGGSFTPPLASGTTIFDPAVDAARQYKYTVAAIGNCPADDSYIYVKIVQAPNAGENGNAMFNTTDSPDDLFSYLNGDPDLGGSWSPPLASGTGIFDPSTDSPGEYTYTVSGGKYCSDASAKVTVGMQSDPLIACPAIDVVEQSFCESIGSDNFHKPMISDLQVIDNGGGVVWYDSATAVIPLEATHLLEDGGVYYADNTSGSCNARPSVTVTILDSPNAGATTSVTLCSNEGPIDLLTLYRPSILGPPDLGGSFSPPLTSGTTIFDPAVDAARQYKYTVAAIGNCPADDSYIYVKVVQAPNAGDDGTAAFVETDEPEDLFTYLGGEPDSGGTWSPPLSSGTGVFDPAVDSPGEYQYLVTNSAGCKDSSYVNVEMFYFDAANTLTVCHKGKTRQVTAAALQAHLKHGDSMGACANSLEVSVYPNPSRGVFNFEGDNSNKISKINIFSSSGILIKSFDVGKRMDLKNINLESLSPGIYIAEIFTDEGKIVKQIVRQ